MRVEKVNYTHRVNTRNNLKSKKSYLIGEMCQKRGREVPSTRCDNWCVDRSTVGSCDGGLACCVAVE